MNISKINMGMANVNFAANAENKKAPLMYEPKIDEQPKAGYHWEHDIDVDRYYAVKDGFKLDEKGNAVSDTIKPTAENFAAYAQIQKAEQAKLMYEPKYGEEPKEGFHWEHDIDADRFYAVKDGFTLDDKGRAVECE